MFATSVVYPVSRVGGLLGDLLRLNPMTPIIEAFRSITVQGSLPPAGPFLYASTVSLLTLAVGWLAFHRAEFRFAENI
jgi:ABC-type polysaccharide/polyol phosphate export permease